MIRRLGPAALKITLFKMEEDKITLTIAGRYVCRWLWKSDKWQQTCTCQHKGSLCIHSYLLTLEVDKALGINSTKKSKNTKTFSQMAYCLKRLQIVCSPRLNMGPPIKQKSSLQKLLKNGNSRWKWSVITMTPKQLYVFIKISLKIVVSA